MKFVAYLSVENNWTFRKHLLDICNFILLFTGNDVALKVAWKITLRGLVAYKPVAYKNKCMRQKAENNEISDLSCVLIFTLNKFTRKHVLGLCMFLNAFLSAKQPAQTF